MTAAVAADHGPADPIDMRRAARILGCHIATVHRYVLGGGGRPPRLRAWRRAGGRYVLSEAEVRALLEPAFPDAKPPPPSRAELDRRHSEAKQRLAARGYKELRF